MLPTDSKLADNAKSGLLPNNARLVAVIDIGTTSIRMAIAQIDPDRTIHNLETLAQAVNLGRDVFTQGRISRSSTELCVSAMKSFRHVLDEYGIRDAQTIRAVATSAVREASNRQAFLDRLYIATGIEVEVIEESEANRFTYLGIQPILEKIKKFQGKRVLVVEAGGGSTEVLALHQGEILFSHTFRLGSLRLRQMLQDFRAPAGQTTHIMQTHIQNTAAQIAHSHELYSTEHLILMGGDIRFAARQLIPDWNKNSISKLYTKDLLKLLEKILASSVDELVMQYHMQYPDAETLGPALLTYGKIAQAMNMKQIHVGSSSLRDGLLYEIAHEGYWSDEFLNQIYQSTIKLGHKYEFDEAHALHVNRLALKLFDELQELHRLLPHHRVILQIAGLLHEIGLFISDRSHHKHSMYLINSSDLFGLSSKQKRIAALTARYHRKATPKPTHEGYGQLRRDDRICVSKLAAILRVADALDTGHSQHVKEFDVDIEDEEVIIQIVGVADVSLEQLALQRKGPLFQQIYGRNVVLRQKRTGVKNP